MLIKTIFNILGHLIIRILILTMKARTDLFDLISSLNQGEKRYFQWFAQQHKGKENKQLKLFEVLASQQRYDEEKVKEALASDPLIRQLPVAKTYLQDRILRSLINYHHCRSKSMTLRYGLDQVEILFLRGLDELCMRKVRKYKKIALEYDHLTTALELIRWELKLVKKHYSKTSPERISDLYAEENQLLLSIQAESLLRQVHDQVFIRVKENLQERSQEQIEKVRRIVNEMKLPISFTDLHFNAKIIYHYIFAYQGQFLGELKGMANHFRSMVTLWDAHPDRIREEPERYLLTCVGYLQSCYVSQDFDQFESFLDQTRKLSLPDRQLAARAFQYIRNLELLYHLNVPSSRPSPTLSIDIEQGLETYGKWFDQGTHFTFYSNLSVFSFQRDKFSLSLRWTNKILNAPRGKIRKDIRLFANCLSLILHFELENYSLLEYLLTQTRRKFEQQPDFTLGPVIVTGLETLLKSAPAPTAKIWQDFRASVQQEDSATLGKREFLLWIDSHLKGKSVHETLLVWGKEEND